MMSVIARDSDKYLTPRPTLWCPLCGFLSVNTMGKVRGVPLIVEQLAEVGEDNDPSEWSAWETTSCGVQAASLCCPSKPMVSAPDRFPPDCPDLCEELSSM